MSKKALVTGGSHNIGQGIAIVLAEKGYDVAITYHGRLEGALDTKKQIEALGQRCFVYQASLEKPDVPEKTVNQAYKDLGGLDLLVCNAGRDSRNSILDVTEADLRFLYENNYRNYILCAAAASRLMVRDGTHGNIIFVTSTRAEQAYPDDFVYGGFKAAIKRACESIALDLSAYHIRVNCVAPGATWPVREGFDPNTIPFIHDSIPLHRSGTARDNGEAVAFLASDAASYITGTTVRVDGGLILPGMLEGHDPVRWVNKDWQERVRKHAMEMLNEAEKPE